MKRNLIRVLCMALAFCLVFSCCASAEIIQIYGNGSKKSYDIKDRFGVTYHYYDIFDGAIKRMDTKDTSRFIRAMLSARAPFPGIRYTYLWDFLGYRYFASEGTDIRLNGKDVYERYTDIINRSNSYINESNVLVESKGMVATELAIREKMAQLGRDELGDKYLKASSFKVNKELQSLKSDGGMTFFSMNAYGKKESQYMTIGSVFYDFRLAYLEDGNLADSAVGAAIKLDDVKGKRGVKVSDGSFKLFKTKWLENKTNTTVHSSTGYDETHTTTMSNSRTDTEGTDKGYMVGGEVTVKHKFPLVGETEVKVKGEYKSSWISSTTKGSSKSVTDTFSFKDTATHEVPPHTKAEALLMQADGSYSFEYDYPVVILFKVAQYVIYNDKVNQLYAVWGEAADSTNSYAVQNLYNRYDHRNDSGYETVHSSGYPINWNAIKNLSGMFTYLSKCIPMSITGGAINMEGVHYKIVLNQPVPIAPLSSVKVDGVKALRVATNGSLDLSSVAPITALDDYNGESVPFYGFDEAKYGDWILADESGNPAQSALAQLAENEYGEWTLNAGENAGTVYIKYVLNEDVKYDIGVGTEDKPEYEQVQIENDDIENDTLIQVKIDDTPTAFNGVVTITAPVEAVLNQPVKLTIDGPELAFADQQGNKIEVEAVEFPEVWSVVGGNNDGIEIVKNWLTVKKDGEYKVFVTFDGVASEPVDVVIVEGIHPAAITLDTEKATLNKGDTLQLKATVYPDNAANKSVTWTSGNENVATVDANGKVTAVGTGFTAITVTTVDGGLSASCDVTVEVPEDGKALDLENLALVKGNSYKLGTPGGASGIWTSNDPGIATVDEKGKVKGVNFGETTLGFKVENAKKGAKFMGKVIAAGDVITIPVAVRAKGEVVNKIALGVKKVTVAVGANYTLEPTLKPVAAKEKQVYYKTSDKTVALVDDFGVITGVKDGKAIITATSASGKTAKVNAVVTNAIGGITLNVKKQALVPGEIFKLIATPVPAKLKDFAPVFESSKPEVASVDADGVITAVAKGKTTITVFAAPGSKIKAKCNITVK